LTGLYNRRVSCRDRAAPGFNRRNEKVPVILYADLDGLKEINDSLGHQEGDRALVTAAELFKDTFAMLMSSHASEAMSCGPRRN